MKLEFRMHRQDDEDLLVEFWNQNSGWGTIEKVAWQSKFMGSPLGPASFALALDKVSGDLIAQFGFIPSCVSVLSRAVRAYRPVAIMVRKDIRENNSLIAVPKLILQLYTYATKQLEQQGIGLIHMVPDHRWARLFRMAPNFKLISFPLYSLPLPWAGSLSLDPEFEVKPMSYEDAGIDGLWEKAKMNYACIVLRDRQALSWKNSHRAFKLWGLYRQEQLVGLFTAYQKDKNRKWQICDILAEDHAEVLRNTLVAACAEGQKAWDNLPEADKSLQEVEIFPSAVMEPLVEAIGFQPLKYKFSLVIHQLNKHLPKELGEAKHWYVSPNE